MKYLVFLLIIFVILSTGLAYTPTIIVGATQATGGTADTANYWDLLDTPLNISTLYTVNATVNATYPMSYITYSQLVENNDTLVSYIDDAVTGITLDFFLTNTTSDISTYYYMQNNDTEEEESSWTFSSISGTEVILNFTNLAVQSLPSTLLSGVYSLHFHAEQTSGTKDVAVYWELYRRWVNTTEQLLIISEPTGDIDSKLNYDLHGVLSSDIELNSDDRLVLRIYAIASGLGTDPTLIIYAEGTTDSHLSIQSSAASFNDIFLRLDGTKPMEGNLNMSSNKLLDVDTINNIYIDEDTPGFTSTGDFYVMSDYTWTNNGTANFRAMYKQYGGYGEFFEVGYDISNSDTYFEMGLFGLPSYFETLGESLYILYDRTGFFDDQICIGEGQDETMDNAIACYSIDNGVDFSYDLDMNNNDIVNVNQLTAENIIVNENITVYGSINTVNINEYNATGDIIPFTDNTYDLGNTSRMWANVFAYKHYFGNDDYISFDESGNYYKFYYDGSGGAMQLWPSTSDIYFSNNDMIDYDDTANSWTFVVDGSPAWVLGDPTDGEADLQLSTNDFIKHNDTLNTYSFISDTSINSYVSHANGTLAQHSATYSQLQAVADAETDDQTLQEVTDQGATTTTQVRFENDVLIDTNTGDYFLRVSRLGSELTQVINMWVDDTTAHFNHTQDEIIDTALITRWDLNPQPGNTGSSTAHEYQWWYNGIEIAVLDKGGNYQMDGNLTVGNQIDVTSANSPTIKTVDTTNGVTLIMQSIDNYGVVGTSSNHNLAFRVNNLDKVTLTSNSLNIDVIPRLNTDTITDSNGEEIVVFDGDGIGITIGDTGGVGASTTLSIENTYINFNQGSIRFNGAGQAIDEFSTDGTLGGNSDTDLPTEKAVKTYIDSKDMVGTHKVQIAPCSYDSSSNLDCSGFTRYAIVNAATGSAIWDLIKMIGVQQSMAGHSVNITRVEVWFNQPGAYTATVDLRYRQTFNTNINRADASAGSVTEASRVNEAGNVYSYTITPNHILLDGYSYDLRIDNMSYPGSNVHRFIGIEVEYIIT